MELMKNIWTQEDQILLERLKGYILAGTMLARPDPSRIFYINKDCSKDGMGAAILQADTSVEARK